MDENSSYDITEDDILTGIKKLGGSAFKDCIKLKEVTLYPELTADFSTTFENCKELTSINIPKGITVTINIAGQSKVLS